MWRGSCSCPDPNLLPPHIPSPAHHLIRPDNGTSRGGACAVLPGPSLRRTGVSLRILGKGYGGQPGLGPNAPD